MRDELLQKLLDNKNSYVSGEEISKELNVSRTAIWKHIKELKKEGYEIISSTNKGYSLVSTSEVLSKTTIFQDLKTEFLGRNLEIHETIDSTNTRAKIIATSGCEDGSCVIAGTQTAGRGRVGRHWESTADKGLFMSVVLKEPFDPVLTGLITLGASVAVVEALSKNIDSYFSIKWPNDIIVNNRKICGILCEMSAEADRINHVVVGIGLNISQGEEDFCGELGEKAISISLLDKKSAKSINYEKLHSRAFWAAQILNELEKVYFILRDDNGYGIITKWKKYSLTLGKQVKIIYRDEIFLGKAVDVNELGELIVELENGETKTVRSGEAQIRGVMGYV